MTVFKHDEEMISQCFPNTDEDGFERDFGESEGKILYETNIDCYQAFLNGDDEEHMDRFLTDYQDRLLVLGMQIKRLNFSLFSSLMRLNDLTNFIRKVRGQPVSPGV